MVNADVRTGVCESKKCKNSDEMPVTTSHHGCLAERQKVATSTKPGLRAKVNIPQRQERESKRAWMAFCSTNFGKRYVPNCWTVNAERHVKDIFDDDGERKRERQCAQHY